jgi:hypothetical protein
LRVTIAAVAFVVIAFGLLIAFNRSPSSSSISSISSSSCHFLPDRLVGRCWGLTALDDVLGITTLESCEQLCCQLGPQKCVTYQFATNSKKCAIGKHVRLGKESGSTSLWCEPLAGTIWTGKKKVKGQKSAVAEGDNRRPPYCKWGDDLPFQCWDLGVERTNSTGGRLGPTECATRCCHTKNCVAWQQLPGRGCFFNEDKLDDLQCDTSVETYMGRRKEFAV